MEKKKIKHLVVDSAAFIKNAPINDIGEKIYSISDVVDEIRDKATKERLQVLPYELKFKEPSSEIIKIINEFSKKTGDYACLSATDIRLLALTYMLEKEHVGTGHLKSAPKHRKTELPINREKDDPTKIVGFYTPKSEMNDDIEDNIEDSEKEEDDNKTMDVDCDDGKEEKSESEDDDGKEEKSESEDDDGWINPNNISQIKKEHEFVDNNIVPEVACITTDFAMQNVLKQIGLNIVGVNGMVIQNVNSYVLRCYACHKITSKMQSKFCPHCGNQTMKRVAVTIDDDGKMQVHINFKRPLNTRGTRYSLPMQKGGKYTQNPILFEDQPLPQQRLTRLGRKKTDVFNPGFEAGESPFATRDVHSRAAHRGMHLNTSTKHNPNSNKKSRKKK